MNASPLSSTLLHRVWRHLFNQIKQHGRYQDANAEDFTQDVFYHLLKKGALADFYARAENEGHFMALLWKTARRYLIDDHRRSQASRRRVWTESVPLHSDPNTVTEIPASPASDPVEACCLRELQAFIDECQELVGAEFRAKGKAALFEACQVCLHGDHENYSDVASSLGISVQALRCALHRMRRKYRSLLASKQLTVAA